MRQLARGSLMDHFWELPAIRWGLWAIGILVAALIVSYLSPPLGTVLHDARAALTGFRLRLGLWADNVIRPRWNQFWHDRGAEPLEPVLAGLARIDGAARTLGREQVAALEALDQRLSAAVGLLTRAAAPRAPEMADRDRITRALAGGGIMRIVVLAVFSVIVGLTNAALLNVFFREFLGTRSPIPTLLPALQIGHVLSALVFLIEMGTGWFIHDNGPEVHDENGELVPRRRTTANRFFYVGAWSALAFLALVELFVYAVLSDRLEIAKQFNLTSDSPMYPVARFFFALFGLALTIVLSAIGHALAEAFEKRKRAAAERTLLNALERRDETIVTNVQRVRESLEGIATAAGRLPSAVAETFREELRLDQAYPGAPVSLFVATVQTGRASCRERV
jgi:hypothetical protein